MGGIVFIGLLFVFGYPFLVFLIAATGLRRRVSSLEDSLATALRELQALRNSVDAARLSAKPAAAPVFTPQQPRAPAAATPAMPVPDTSLAPAPAADAAAAPTPAAAVDTAAVPDPAPAPVSAAIAAPAAQQPATAPEPAAPPPPPFRAAPIFAEPPRLSVPTPSAPATPAPRPAAAPPAPAQATPHLPALAPAAAAPAPPRATSPAWLSAVKNWLFTGNLVAKMGLLILFIGVSFLLKYASERVTVPIELRLAGIVAADIALLVWGWRMRLTHRSLSLPIQGAALGILMLVTFGAFRIYHLIPPGLAFGLLFVLTAFTCILAVMQNAVWLAVFGIAGGFVSPILTSTGQGSHIALFSYYALLNAGVLAIALKRTWRALNLLGFAFTFIIGTTWGVLRYSAADHYLSAQLFLLLFFVFYVAIALVYAMRQSVQVKAYVDATLVFGTPLAAFALQLGLVKNVEFGHAYSALGFGIFYTVLALALWRRRGSGMKLLVESFMALGVVFGTLAIPFALDGRWTSAAWALEGAGVVWVALRQRHRLTFWFGMLVQAGAWISFIGAISGLSGEAARDANLWLGFLILAGTAFFMAITLRKETDGEVQAFPAVASAFLGFAALWLLGGAWTEIILRQTGTTMANLLVASALAVAAILATIALRMHWPRARIFALMAQVAAGATLFALSALSWDWTHASPDLFSEPLLGAFMVCAAAGFTAWNMWRQPLDMGLGALSRLMLGWSAFWLFGPILSTLSGFLVLHLPQAWHTIPRGHGQWSLYFTGVALAALAAAQGARRSGWTDLRWLSAAPWIALPLATVMMFVVLFERESIPGVVPWLGFAALWLAGEVLLRAWHANAWRLPSTVLKAIHLVRTAGPWIMLWKVGELAINNWLLGPVGQRALLADGGFAVSGSWANFVPAWAMMAVVVWLIGRAGKDQWPAAPIGAWYRRVLIPAAVAWSLLLAALWNLAQDGSMAPLPYVPLLNPLDLTTAFALALAAFAWRMLKTEREAWAPAVRQRFDKLPVAAAVVAYVWFNLILLRTASHVLDIDYNAGALFASQTVQAMLSLVWSITALVLMRWATRRVARRWWITGAAFLALVVAKLFLVDLDGSGSVGRIVSFVGVGLLMVLIGYLAPYPNDSTPDTARDAT